MTRATRAHPDELVVGLVSVSDRASAGQYADEGVPALRRWLDAALKSPWQGHERLIADERARIEATLVELVDEVGCDLVLTTGGTGPSRRDVTPEATLAVATRELPGYGEQMRRISLEFVPTALLSRQVGALREIAGHAALILNLPGQPKSITETLGGLHDAASGRRVHGIFASVPYCIQLIGGPYVETNEEVVQAFRPASARRASPGKGVPP
jgi:molybdopterin adenylyltransferase